MPAPVATPLIAATVGFSSRSTSEISDVSRWLSWRNSRGSQSRSKRLRSPPALNALAPAGQDHGAHGARRRRRARRPRAAPTPARRRSRCGVGAVEREQQDAVVAECLGHRIHGRRWYGQAGDRGVPALPAPREPRPVGRRGDRPQRRRGGLAARRRRPHHRARRRLLRGGGGRGRAPARLLRRRPPPRSSTFRGSTRSATRGSSRATRTRSASTIPRAHVSDAFAELFERAAARGGRGAPGSRRSGSTTWSWRAWSSPPASTRCSNLDDDRLPGLREGMELVLRDERWHVGFGTRCLADATSATTRSPRSWPRASAPRRCGRPSRPSGSTNTLRTGAWRRCGEAGDAARSPAPSRRWCSCTKASARSGCGATSRRGWRHATGRRALIYSRAGHGFSDVPGRAADPALHARGGAGRAAGLLAEPDRAPGARRPQRRRLDRAHPRVRSTPSAGSSCSRRTSSWRMSP